MIKIKRSSCPEVLKGSPSRGKKYRRTSVVRALWRMQYRKCCYCEQQIPEEGHSKAVEHFRPKSIYKDRKNDWKNLLLACPQCNGEKSNKFPVMLTRNSKEVKVLYTSTTQSGAIPAIINPSNEKIDPEAHIGFIVDINKPEEYGLTKKETKIGRTTVEVIGLDDIFYTRKRRTFCANLWKSHVNLLSTQNLGNEQGLEVEKRCFRQYMSATNEFSGFARAYAKFYKLDEKFNISIPRGADE